jgi:uncharacterized protein
MKPFRKHVALAVDGGGIRGIIATRALTILEESLGKPLHDVFRLAAGTSTGSIISAGIAGGLTAEYLNQLYCALGPKVFKKNWRSILWPLTPYRYTSAGLSQALAGVVGTHKMGDFWNPEDPFDVVMTTFDLVKNQTCFIKPWKDEYKNWPVSQAILASSSVPTYFPAVEGRYVDGGVGSYANPCYLAAYELRFCLGWDPAETTLISLGTGRDPHKFRPGQADRLQAWDWIAPVLGAFLQSADDQQVNLVKTFFTGLDFRRFQVDLKQSIDMDDSSKVKALSAYGDDMGRMILNDLYDTSLGAIPMRMVI